MPRTPDPPPFFELEIDTSPEARAQYLEAIKFLLKRVDERRARNAEAGKMAQSIKM